MLTTEVKNVDTQDIKVNNPSTSQTHDDQTPAQHPRENAKFDVKNKDDQKRQLKMLLTRSTRNIHYW